MKQKLQIAQPYVFAVFFEIDGQQRPMRMVKGKVFNHVDEARECMYEFALTLINDFTADGYKVSVRANCHILKMFAKHPDKKLDLCDVVTYRILPIRTNAIWVENGKYYLEMQ